MAYDYSLSYSVNTDDLRNASSLIDDLNNKTSTWSQNTKSQLNDVNYTLNALSQSVDDLNGRLGAAMMNSSEAMKQFTSIMAAAQQQTSQSTSGMCDDILKVSEAIVAVNVAGSVLKAIGGTAGEAFSTVGSAATLAAEAIAVVAVNSAKVVTAVAPVAWEVVGGFVASQIAANAAGLAIVGVADAIAVSVTKIREFRAEAAAFQEIMRFTGNSTGLTTDQVQGQVGSIYGQTTNLNRAQIDTAMASLIAQSNKVQLAASDFTNIAQTGIQYADSTAQDPKKILELLANTDSLVKSYDKLAEAGINLTASELKRGAAIEENIKKAQEEEDWNKAINLTLEERAIKLEAASRASAEWADKQDKSIQLNHQLEEALARVERQIGATFDAAGNSRFVVFLQDVYDGLKNIAIQILNISAALPKGSVVNPAGHMMSGVAEWLGASPETAKTIGTVFAPLGRAAEWLTSSDPADEQAAIVKKNMAEWQAGKDAEARAAALAEKYGQDHKKTASGADTGSGSSVDNLIEKLQNNLTAQQELNKAWEEGNVAKVHQIELDKAIQQAQIGEKDGREAEIDQLMRATDAAKQLNAALQHRYEQGKELRASNQNLSYLGMGTDDAARAKAEDTVKNWYADHYGDVSQLDDKLKEIYQDELNRADAIANQNLEYQKQKAAIDELGTFGSQVFDRLGASLTQAFTQGNGAAINFKSILQGIESEIIQEMVKLAAINPIKNMISGGSSLPTISSVMSAFGGSSGQGAIQLVGGSTPGMMTSSGGGGSGVNLSGIVNSSTGMTSGGYTFAPTATSAGGGMSALQGVGNLASLANMTGVGNSIWGASGSLSGYLFGNAGGTLVGLEGIAGGAPGTLSGAGLLGNYGTLLGSSDLASSFLPGIGALASAGMSFANGQYGSGAGTLAGAGIGSLILPGIGTAIGGMLGGFLGGLFDGGSDHGPSADASIYTGNASVAGVPFGPIVNAQSATWVPTAQDPTYMDYYSRVGVIDAGGQPINPNHLYASLQGEAHHGGDVGPMIASNKAFAESFNEMMDAYKLRLEKQGNYLIVAGENDNPGYGSTDSLMLALANSGSIAGEGAVGSLFKNAQKKNFTSTKDLQAALQFAAGIDDTAFSVDRNQYENMQHQLDSTYNSNMSQASKYGVDSSYITSAYDIQTNRNTQDQGMAQLKSDNSLTARQAALNGDSVAQVKATLEVTQAEEMLAAQRDKMTDLNKLAAVQEQEYAKAVEQATLKMQTANTAIYSTGLQYLGETIPAAFATIAANSNTAILNAQQNGQDVSTATAVQNVATFKSQIQAVLSVASSQAQLLQSQLQQSGVLRDTASSMADARLTPQQAYDTAISRWRDDLSKAQGGNLDALSKLTSYGQAAVSAESSVYGGTQTTIYNEVSKGLNDMADQIDQQNGINATDAKQQLNQLQTIAIAANKQLTATQTSADALQGYFDSAVSNEKDALGVLSDLKSTMQNGLNALITINSTTKIAEIQAAAQQSAVKSTDTITNATNAASASNAAAAASSSSSSSSSADVSMKGNKNAPDSLAFLGISDPTQLTTTMVGKALSWLEGAYNLTPAESAAYKSWRQGTIDLRNSDKAAFYSKYFTPDGLNTTPIYNQEMAFAIMGAGRIPGYASGTNFAPGGWSMVGERGPEMMYVPRGSTVVPNGGDPNAAIVAELQELRKLVAAVGLRLADTGAQTVDATNRLGVGLQTAALRPQAMAA